jgi:catechol 2,3-dioxygenase-like lactoylglutathione lyase family enzyme
VNEVNAPQLVEAVIETSTPGDILEVYRAVCGIEPQGSGDGGCFQLGSAGLSIRPAPVTGGLTSITISVDDLASRRAALTAAGIQFEESAGMISVSKDDAGGAMVGLVESAASEASPAGARLDHVALRVRDLAESSARWLAITGIEPLQMGLHPVSNGAFQAARVLLGERMIELISPEPGVPSRIADRLQSHGEGVAALALPVDDLPEVLERLEKRGVRVLRQDPHWMIHPQDAGGVLVQLTPRVAH